MEGGWQGKKGETVRGKQKKKKGRHRMRNSERGAAPKFQLFHNPEFMC